MSARSHGPGVLHGMIMEAHAQELPAPSMFSATTSIAVSFPVYRPEDVLQKLQDIAGTGAT